MNKTVPAVSIIIPMYNVEKYVGECLDSILAQTFTDYEVIAVDDSSTDKTCEIVESYLPRFNGKLQLIRSEKNSGGHVGIPRNKGMRYAVGDYLYFMDSDDAIVDTALEELYNLAEEYHVELVHCERFYRALGETVTTDKKLLEIGSDERTDFVTKPTLMPNDLAERVREFNAGKFWTAPWIHLMKRDLVFKNDIKFPEIKIGDDDIFNLQLLCWAKDILRVPNVFYVWRKRDDSNIRMSKDVAKTMTKWMTSVFHAIGIIDKFTNNFEILRKNPDLKYGIFEFFTAGHLFPLIPIYAQIPAWQLDPLIRRELSEIEDKTALTAFLFARMNLMNVQLVRAQNLLRQQPKEAQDFQRQNEIIQRQQAQIQELQQQLRNVHDIFR